VTDILGCNSFVWYFILPNFLNLRRRRGCSNSRPIIPNPHQRRHCVSPLTAAVRTLTRALSHHNTRRSLSVRPAVVLAALSAISRYHGRRARLFCASNSANVSKRGARRVKWAADKLEPALMGRKRSAEQLAVSWWMTSKWQDIRTHAVNLML